MTTWHKIEDVLPKDGQDIAFIVHAPEFYFDGVTRNRFAYENGRKLGGRFDLRTYEAGGGGFSTPGHGYAASHWTPMPEFKEES